MRARQTVSPPLPELGSIKEGKDNETKYGTGDRGLSRLQIKNLCLEASYAWTS